MADDILTKLQNDIAFRLRLQAKVSNLYEIHHPHMVRVPTIYEEAADEIERLREDVIYWQALSYCPKCGCGQCQDNEEALNNE